MRSSPAQTPAPAPSPALPPVAAQVPSPAAAPTTPLPHHFEVPQNAQGAQWLQQIGAQLSDQLISARSRRNALASQYEKATGVNRAGLQQQLQILDNRIAQLEVDIEEVGRLKTQMPQWIASTAPPWVPRLGPMVGGAPPNVFPMVLAFLLLLPVALTATRWLWRRSSRSPVPPGWTEAADRLERMEQAIDTIAIEVERVSEGQRYISKILTQQSSDAARNGSVEAAAQNAGQPLPALGPGSPDPVAIQQREEVRVRRS